jgi:hypothetical protein
MAVTDDDVLALILQGKTTQLVEAMAPLSESERKAIFPKVSRLKKRFDRREWNQPYAEVLTGEFESLRKYIGSKNVLSKMKNFFVKNVETAVLGNSVSNDPYISTACELATLGLGLSKDVARISVFEYWWDKSEDLLIKVLDDRRPDWADGWLRKRLEITSDGVWFSWDLLRDLIDRGICQKPDVEGYWHLMARGLGDRRWDESEPTPILDALHEKAEYRDDVWRFFEFEIEIFIGTYDKTRREQGRETWSSAIIKLANEGVLDRDRLLNECLVPLLKNLKNYTLSGFARMHEDLKPTADEMAERQNKYQELLAVESTSMVGFGVKMLKKLADANNLDIESFLKSCWIVFSVKTKAPAKTVLTIYKKIVDANPEKKSQITAILAEHATTHEADDISEVALKLLEKWKEDWADSVPGTLSDKSTQMPSSVQVNLRELIGTLPDEPIIHESSQSGFEERIDTCKKVVQRLSKEIVIPAGIDDVLASLDTGEWPPPLDFDCFQTGVLDRAAPVEPIQTADDLLDRVAHAIEDIDTALEAERILDGISRLHNVIPENFERRSAPIANRFSPYDRERFEAGELSVNIASDTVRLLIWQWLRGVKPVSFVGRIYRFIAGPDGMDAFFHGRVEAVRRRMGEGTVAPVLSFPTHSPAWVDPVVFVERWLECEKAGVEPDIHDVIQGLLRLAPDQRDEALPLAKHIKHPWSTPLRWALGDSVEPKPVQKDVDLWIAARAAKPGNPVIHTNDKKLKELGPDALEPCSIQWTVVVEEKKYQYRPNSEETHYIRKIELDIAPPFKSSHTAATRPTLFFHVYEKSAYGDFHTAWEMEWMTTVWPLRGDVVCAWGLRPLINRLDENASSWTPNHWYLIPLFEPNTYWTDIHHLTALVGLAGKDQDVRGTAIDACIEAIADSRLAPQSFAETLVKLNVPRWLKLNRVAESFSEISRVSDLHAEVMGYATEELIVSYETLPKDVHHLLTVFLDILSQLGKEPSPALREKLSPIKGSTKTAKLAKKVLALKDSTSEGIRESRVELLESRVALAERWSGVEIEKT